MRIGVLLMLIATVLGALGQYLFKLAANTYGDKGLLALLLNEYAIGGVTLYGLATVIYIYALRGEELSTLAPLIALSYLWAALLGVVLLGEKVTFMKWLGITMIVLGAILVVGG